MQNSKSKNMSRPLSN